MTEKQRLIMQEKIRIHGENIRSIFGFSLKTDMLPICKKLLALETKANRLMVDYCNGLVSGDTLDYAEEKILNTLFFILKLSHFEPLAKAIIINQDPRGYTLKIDSSYVAANNLEIFRDFGGYGILSPDFRFSL